MWLYQDKMIMWSLISQEFCKCLNNTVTKLGNNFYPGDVLAGLF